MEKLSNKEFNEKWRGKTKQFALKVIALSDEMPKKESARVINQQLLRSATSVAANFRAACRGRSKQEYYSKLCIVVEEAYSLTLLLSYSLTVFKHPPINQ